jgi:uncharacterized protein (DUF488 family)
MIQAHVILTIGHSSHPIERFIALLDEARVTAIVDVRSAPVSRYVPQFNKEPLVQALAEQEIAYGFLGNALGGRPRQLHLFTKGVADYEKMAKSPVFQSGIVRLIDAAERNRIAIMCSEADPLDCHRCLLVGRALVRSGCEIAHILPSGETSSQGSVEDRMLELENLTDAALLFRTHEERLNEAYRSRARRVAYAESTENDFQSVRRPTRA